MRPKNSTRRQKMEIQISLWLLRLRTSRRHLIILTRMSLMRMLMIKLNELFHFLSTTPLLHLVLSIFLFSRFNDLYSVLLKFILLCLVWDLLYDFESNLSFLIGLYIIIRISIHPSFENRYLLFGIFWLLFTLFIFDDWTIFWNSWNWRFLSIQGSVFRIDFTFCVIIIFISSLLY